MKKRKTIIIAFIVVLIIGIGIAAVMILNKNKNIEDIIQLGTENVEEEKKVETVKKGVTIFSGNDRPIAVMIDNHKGAWPQAGLTKAYAIYEIIVEGGETRMMALFKGANAEKIGPVRSSRHYFLDYALENSAIYVHYGWSPKAESDIASLKVNNINGITESDSNFWRIKQKSSPHNVLTSIENIKKMAESKKYSLTSNSASVLKYTTDEIELSDEIQANKVVIPYSTLHTTSYQYDATTKRYSRYARGSKQTDFETGEILTTKNIIITFAQNVDLKDEENKGRQDLKNVGTKDGYYITNGKAIKIKCKKDSRTSKTVYKDLNGNEINVNDGNTFFNICPIDADVKLE